MLTLLDRYIIYSEMLNIHEVIKRFNEKGIAIRYYGLCDSLSVISWDNKRNFKQKNIHITELPELMKKKPKDTSLYWFNPTNQAIRIKHLKSCIRSVVKKMNYDLDNY